MSAAIAEYTSINIFIVSGVFHCMRTAIARKIAGMRESTANIVGYITIEISA